MPALVSFFNSVHDFSRVGIHQNPDECHYCESSVPLNSLASHEVICSKNPDNICKHCKAVVEDGAGRQHPTSRWNHTTKREHHEAECRKNTRNCTHCSTPVQSLSLASHEQCCRKNPDNICKHCKAVVEDGAGRQHPTSRWNHTTKREHHEAECWKNTRNCTHCSTPVQSLSLAPHEQCCRKNPDNICKHCKAVVEDGAGRQHPTSRWNHTTKREHHEAECARNPNRNTTEGFSGVGSEYPGNPVETMYHGTTVANATCITQGGKFKPSATGMLGAGVYVSKNIEKARRYGGNNNIILELRVHISNSLSSLLIVDRWLQIAGFFVSKCETVLTHLIR